MDAGGRPPRIPLLWSLAAGVAAGIAAHDRLGPLLPSVLLALALLGLIAAWRRGGLRGRRAAWAVLLVSAAATPAWCQLRGGRAPRDDVAAWASEEPALVALRGTAVSAAVVRPASRGSLAPFDPRPPATSLVLAVRSIGLAGAASRPASGRILVWIDGVAAPIRPGDEITARGFLRGASPPRNPGEPDARRAIRARARAGVLRVADPEAVRVVGRSRSLAARWSRLRDRWRRSARAHLVAGGAGRDAPRALVTALVLGQRDPALPEDDLRRIGLGHVLAISGLHVGVLAGFVVLLARVGGAGRRARGALVIVVIAAYLVLVESRLPVLRAGIMTITAALGGLTGRRLRADGLIALSAVALLLWRPGQLMMAGFQLSFAVVLALVALGPRVRRRWAGDGLTAAPAPLAALRGSAATTSTAWVVAAPLIAHHFGLVAPLGIPLTMLALPLVAVLVAGGFAQIVIGGLASWAAALLDAPLAMAASALLAVAAATGALPAAALFVPRPALAWTVAALAWSCVWAGRAAPRGGPLLAAGALVLIAALLAPLASGSRAVLRIDMLAVGDGACVLVRSGRSAVLFDAGASRDLDIGRRRIVPALRELGVRRLEAIIISHGNIDHYGAVPDIVAALPVGEILVSPPVAMDEAPAVRGLRRAIAARGVPLRVTSRGARRIFGDARWTWLHPSAGTDPESSNEASIVVRVEAAGRRMLLCGDIERAAIQRLLAGGDDLRADVCELPHHGAHHPLAEAFIGEVDPSIVLQSTGWRRWRDDGWRDGLRGRRRLVTARDGAVWVEITRGGAMRAGAFREGWEARTE